MPDAKTLVAGVVLSNSDGMYLLVQEAQEIVRGLWNLPAGHVDEGETTSEAALREGTEETGYQLRLIQDKPIYVDDNEDGITKYAYYAKIIGGELNIPQDELLDAKWFSYEDVKRISEQGKLRSPWTIESIKVVQKELQS